MIDRRFSRTLFFLTVVLALLIFAILAQLALAQVGGIYDSKPAIPEMSEIQSGKFETEPSISLFNLIREENASFMERPNHS